MPEMPCNKTFIGVDPGKHGGLVCMDYDGRVLDLIRMPSTESDVWKWFIEIYDPSVRTVAVIEKVHSMPKQGVASSFTFGMGYGGLRMALIAAGIPFDQVTPQKWMKAIGIPPRKKTDTNNQWKNRLKAHAQQLFPQENITLATADALLIAEYCRRAYR
jgi:crossover junction endodeoxyribonuclease RuvC